MGMVMVVDVDVVSIAWYGMVRWDTALYHTVQYSTVQCDEAWYRIVSYAMAFCIQYMVCSVRYIVCGVQHAACGTHTGYDTLCTRCRILNAR